MVDIQEKWVIAKRANLCFAVQVTVQDIFGLGDDGSYGSVFIHVKIYLPATRNGVRSHTEGSNKWS